MLTLASPIIFRRGTNTTTETTNPGNRKSHRKKRAVAVEKPGIHRGESTPKDVEKPRTKIKMKMMMIMGNKNGRQKSKMMMMMGKKAQKQKKTVQTCSDFDYAKSAEQRGLTHKGPESSTKSSKPHAPNVLFIMTDQQRFDAIRRVQHELPGYANVTTKIRTPNLDRLSKQGAYFQNAYTQMSICGPARASLRTGCTVARTGVNSNKFIKEHLEGPPEFQQKIRALRGLDQVLVEQLGYHAEHYGKSHLADTLFKTTVGQRDCSVLASNNLDFEKHQFFFDGGHKFQKQYKGFLEHAVSRGLLMHGQLKEGEVIDPFSQFPYTPSQLDLMYGKPEGVEPLPEASGSCVGRFSLSENFTSSHYVGVMANKALERLLSAQQQSSNHGNLNTKPWFLTVSFNSPHAPFVPVQKYLDYYLTRSDELYHSPGSFHDTLKQSPYQNKSKNGYLNIPGPEAIQKWTAHYYALVEEVDDYVGTLLDTLEVHSDPSLPTMIVFTSDHGEMLGAHGMQGKFVFYEESAHVPLFISFSGMIQPDTQVEQVVSHIDVVPTILDYIGASKLDTSDGTSLRSFIEKTSYNQHHDEDVVVAEWARGVPFMVRKGPYKLMLGNTQKQLSGLYDLSRDPFEMDNLLAMTNPSRHALSKAEHLKCLLLDWMKRMDGPSKDYSSSLLDWMKQKNGPPKGYYSSPSGLARTGPGGAMEEVRLLQSWKATDFWVGDSEIHFGTPIWDGHVYIRNEFLYLGQQTLGPAVQVSISVEGADAELFHLDPSQILAHPQECIQIKVSFQSSTFIQNLRLDACIVVFYGDSEAKHTVNLSV